LVAWPRRPRPRSRGNRISTRYRTDPKDWAGVTILLSNQGSCRESQETKPPPAAAARGLLTCELQLLPLPKLSKNSTWLRGTAS